MNPSMTTSILCFSIVVLIQNGHMANAISRSVPLSDDELQQLHNDGYGLPPNPPADVVTGTNIIGHLPSQSNAYDENDEVADKNAAPRLKRVHGLSLLRADGKLFKPVMGQSDEHKRFMWLRSRKGVYY